MANTFASDCILLVGKLERRIGDAAHACFVMQRAARVGGVPDTPVNGELDVFEFEGLAPGIWFG